MTNEVAIGRNVEMIRAAATRVIRGRVPAEVRKELREAVKSGLLGHLKKDGLKPEIFFHPDHRNGAIERQNREALYGLQCISKVIAMPSAEEKIQAALRKLGVE